MTIHKICFILTPNLYLLIKYCTFIIIKNILIKTLHRFPDQKHMDFHLNKQQVTQYSESPYILKHESDVLEVEVHNRL